MLDRAIRLTGPFVTMIYAMITGDMFRFSIIFVILLFGFSQAFYFTQSEFEGEDSLFYNYHGTWMGLIHMTLGEYEVSYEIDKNKFGSS